MSATSKRSCIGLETSLADFWMGLMTAIRSPPSIDATRNAKMYLRSTLDEIEESELDLNAELARLTQVVMRAQQARAAGERVDVSRLKSTLLQSKKCRVKLTTLAKKKLALENHMDTLDNSELNQHVLQSMQKTSHALKGMGLDKALESVDRVMTDLEENNADIASIQNTLSMSFDTSEDFDWEAEMQLLLNTDAYFGSTNPQKVDVSAPVTSNGISLELKPDVSVAVGVAHVELKSPTNADDSAVSDDAVVLAET
jgi:hypothetical protein